MGGSQRERAKHRKMTRYDGNDILNTGDTLVEGSLRHEVGRKDASAHKPRKDRQVLNAEYSGRVGRRRDPHRGLRYTDPKTAVMRAASGAKARMGWSVRKSNDGFKVSIPDPYKNHVLDDTYADAFRDAVTVFAEEMFIEHGRQYNHKALINFATVFLNRGLHFMKLPRAHNDPTLQNKVGFKNVLPKDENGQSFSNQNGRDLQQWLILDFLRLFVGRSSEDLYTTKHGGPSCRPFPFTRRGGNTNVNETELLNKVSAWYNSLDVWKTVARHCGNFICPTGYTMIYGERQLVHKMPLGKPDEVFKQKGWILKRASFSHLLRRWTKHDVSLASTPNTNDQPDHKTLVTGKVRTIPVSVQHSSDGFVTLRGGGENPNWKPVSRSINAGRGSRSKVNRTPEPHKSVDQEQVSRINRMHASIDLTPSSEHASKSVLEFSDLFRKFLSEDEKEGNKPTPISLDGAIAGQDRRDKMLRTVHLNKRQRTGSPPPFGDNPYNVLSTEEEEEEEKEDPDETDTSSDASSQHPLRRTSCRHFPCTGPPRSVNVQSTSRPAPASVPAGGSSSGNVPTDASVSSNNTNNSSSSSSSSNKKKKKKKVKKSSATTNNNACSKTRVGASGFMTRYGLVDDVIAEYGAVPDSPHGRDFIFDSTEIVCFNESFVVRGNAGLPQLPLSLDRAVTMLNGTVIRHTDFGGAPFCGLTCVDMANYTMDSRNRKPDPYRYANMIPQRESAHMSYNSKKLFMEFEHDIIDTVGTDVALIQYCKSVGLGVMIIAIDDQGKTTCQALEDVGTNRYIVLVHTRKFGGHWTLFGKNSSNRNHMYLSGKYRSHDKGWKYCGYGRSIKFGRLMLRENNNDVRTFTDQREKIEVQGMLQEVFVSSTKIHFLGKKMRLNKPFLSAVKKVTGWESLGPFKRNSTYYIDATRSHNMMRNLTMCRTPKDVEDTLSCLVLGRSINGDVSPTVINDTRKVMRKLYNKLPHEHAVENTEGMITVNTPGSTSLIAGIPTVINNHGLATMKGGGGHFCANHVTPTKVREEGIVNKVSKLDVAVMVAPIGCPIEEGLPVGAGMMGVTDEVTTLSAFWSRGCSKDQNDVNPKEMSQFVKDSIEFIDDYVSKTEVQHLPEEDVTLNGLIKQFIKVNKNKKPAKWIERRVRDHIRYETGLMHPKELLKYKRHGCFVKRYESNIKEYGSKIKMRPRLIMTMSPYMQFVICHISEICDAWYDGPIAQFQVKHMNTEQMMEKIRSAQDKPHIITDYSAFESSITTDVRRIEMHLIRSLLIKAGYTGTLRFLDELCLDGGRVLSIPGFKLYINSRCSGDYWTSLGNGVVAICLMRYCWSKGDQETMFSMIAEGDDGCVDLNVPDESLLKDLGMKFSSTFVGTTPADTDFLRCLWSYKRWLNIGRVMSKIFWVRGTNLKRSKQMFLLRCSALSLHHLSPGHPVLWAVVKHIEYRTRGYNNFKSSPLFLDSWKEWDMSGNFPTIKRDDSMRMLISEGRIGFPPLPLIVQNILEERILSGDLRTLGLLNDYDDYKFNFLSSNKDNIDWSQDDVEHVYRSHNIPYVKDDLTSYKEFGLVRLPEKGVSSPNPVANTAGN